MKFTIAREEFLKSVLNASRVAWNKVDPLLANLKLDLDNDKLTLTGSNGSLTIITTVNAYHLDREIIRNIEPGSILVNAKLLTDIVKRFDGNEVYFDVLDGTLVKIECDNTNFKIGAIPASEYRNLDTSLDGIKMDISANEFVDAVNQVAFSASEKTTRPVLTAVNAECNSSFLTFTATDGARLGKKDINVTNNDFFSVNIPAKSLIEAAKSVTSEERVTLYISDNKVCFEFKDTVIITNLIKGDYPNVRNIIPRNFYYYLEVNANEFLKAIETGAIITGERENIVKVIMEEGKVTVTSKSQQAGTSETRLDLFKYTGEKLEMAFNVSYVTSAIKSLKCQDVLISFVGEMKPFTITNKNDPSIIQLITPVRTY